MISSLTSVREAFKSVISGLGYAVYDRGRKVMDMPHVIIGEQTEQQQGDQGEDGQIATIEIEVINAWSSDYGDRAKSDDIVNGIMSALITKPHTLAIPLFDMPVLVVDSVSSATSQSESQTIVTTTMRFRMQLFESAVDYLVDDTGRYITDDSGNYITLN